MTTSTAVTTTSRDGTTIGYKQHGEGPGLVVLHGAMSSAHNHEQLSEALSSTFTVTVPDRRGRGLSGESGPEHGLRQEVEDLQAVMAATGAHDVFGVSSGGLIALQAALSLPDVRRVAVYEPPLLADPAWAGALLAQLERELDAGDVAAALVTAMQGAEMGPRVFNALPAWVLKPLIRMAIRAEDRKGAGEYLPMRALAPTLPADFRLVVETSGQEERFRAIDRDALLLGGSQSPAYLTRALDRLAGVIPRAQRVELPRAGHAASWNADRGGKPAPVAEELRRFFSRTESPEGQPVPSSTSR